MNWIIEKAKEIYQKYGSDDLDFVVGKLGAEIIEHPLTKRVKEAYFKGGNYSEHLIFELTEKFQVPGELIRKRLKFEKLLRQDRISFKLKVND